MYFNLINPVTDHKNYPDQDFTELKHSEVLSLKIWSDQFHFDSHIDFTSTWLCPEIFYHCIKNTDSPASKYSELLVSHYGDLRSERHLYSYPSRAALIVEHSVAESCSVKIYSYISPAYHINFFTLLDYKNNQLIWHIMIYIW